MTDEVTPVAQTKPTLVAWLKSTLYSVGNFFIRYPLATAGTILLVAFAVFMGVFGQKIQIGGILGQLWGKVHPKDMPNAPVVTPPPGRVDDKGQVIAPGQSDDKGFVQAPVVLPIKDPGILSDPTTITVTHPDGKDVTIPLPTGVKNSDVKQVVLVSPNVYQISNNDTGVDASKILEDLNK
jgi:hypothetical protein